MHVWKHPAAAVALAAALAIPALPTPAEAFCGFYVSGASDNLYNDATQVVLMREGTRTVLSMQNNYQGPAEDFAMVIPVPVILQKENVVTLPGEIFQRVDQMDAPRLVEYWEQDPCPPEYDNLRMADYGVDYMMDMPMPSMAEAAGAPPPVRIEAQFEVEEYEIVILSADDAAALDRWLKDNRYNIPQGAEPVLRPYVESGTKFFVARVDAKKVRFDAQGKALLSPLRFFYDSEDFALPVRLGMLNAKGHQDLIVHILARGQRYEVANYKNVTIPTNIGVGEDAKERFGEFYAALFDRTLEKNPGAVVTEYAWDASTCDPCPGPNLNGQDFNHLGAEVLADKNPWGFVLTRLHARYTKESLGEDLVFKAAPPIVGGREVHGSNGELEHGSSPSGMNNFQGRYIIRHPWTGEANCDDPRFGVWGGPPNGGSGVTPARNLADAPRGGIDLPEIVRQDIPEIEVEADNEGITMSYPPKVSPDRMTCGPCAMAASPHRSPWLPGAALLLALGALVVVRRRR